MTRARLDALSLREGDFVTVHLGEWPDGVTLRGPLVRLHGALVLGHLTIVRFDGDPCELLQRPGATLTTAEEELRERLRADGRLWKLAHDEGEARGRAEVLAKVEALAATWADGPFADAVVFTPVGCAADLRALAAEADR